MLSILAMPKGGLLLPRLRSDSGLVPEVKQLGFQLTQTSLSKWSTFYILLLPFVSFCKIEHIQQHITTYNNI